MKIAYMMTDGRAHDLRFVEENHEAAPGEVMLDGDMLPDIESLHDPEYLADQAKEAEDAAVKARLHEIDMKSIRSLREWVAKQPDASEYLKTYEADAIAQRSKLSK